MGTPTARWLVSHARNPVAPTAPPATPFPPFVRPPGVRPPTSTSRRDSPRPSPAPLDRTPWSLAVTRGVCAGLLVVVLGLLVWSVVPTLLGWRSQVVLTGSMRPRIQPGDLVLAAPPVPGQVKPGRVVLFRDPVRPERTIVHRLQRYDNNGDLVTKGDANASEDSTPVAPRAVLGIPRLRVPYVGRPVVWIHEKDTAALLISSGVLSLGAAALCWPLGGEPTPATRNTNRRGHRR